MKTTFDTVAKVVGVLAILLFVVLLLTPDSNADNFGRFRGQITIRNYARDPYLLKLMNRDGTVKFYVDSAGNPYPVYPSGSSAHFTIADSGRVQGPFLVNGKLTVKDSAWIKGPTVVSGNFQATGTSTLPILSSTTGTITNLASTSGTITTLSATTATVSGVASLQSTSASTLQFTSTAATTSTINGWLVTSGPTTGLVLTSANGTKYILYVTDAGSVLSAAH